MTLELVLKEFGIDSDAAKELASSPDFHHKTKTVDELRDIFKRIQEVYNCTLEDVVGAVLKHPSFAGYDHNRVVRNADRLAKYVGLPKQEVRNRISTEDRPPPVSAPFGRSDWWYARFARVGLPVSSGYSSESETLCKPLVFHQWNIQL